MEAALYQGWAEPIASIPSDGDGLADPAEDSARRAPVRHTPTAQTPAARAAGSGTFTLGAAEATAIRGAIRDMGVRAVPKPLQFLSGAEASGHCRVATAPRACEEWDRLDAEGGRA